MLSLLPVVHINTIDISNEKINTINVCLNCVIDGRLQRTQKLWFTDKDYVKYIKIVAIQSDDPELTEKLLFSNFFDVDVSEENLKKTDDKKISTDDLRILLQDGGIVRKEKDLDLENIENPTNRLKKFNKDEEIEYQIPIKFQFSIKSENLEHLSYHVFATYDFEAIKNDFKSENVDEGNFFKDSGGVLSSEVVFDEGEINDTSYVFLDSEENQWPGKVISENEQWIGIDPNNNKIVLQIVEIQNPKIRDLREEIRTLNSIGGGSELGQFIIEPKFGRKEGYFSEFFLSRGLKGEAGFFFIFDVGKFLSEQSVYGELFSNMEEEKKKKILNSVSIKSIKVWRRRVSRTNYESSKLGHVSMTRADFDSNQIDELVAYSSPAKNGEFENFQPEIGNVEIHRIFNDLSKISFKGVDKEIAKITNGLYSYYVDIELEDSIVQFMGKMLAEFIEARNNLIRYSEALQDPRNYDYELDKVTPTFKERITEEELSELSKAVTLSADFVDLLNFPLFTRSFYIQNSLRKILPESTSLVVLNFYIKFLLNLEKTIYNLFTNSTGLVEGVTNNQTGGNSSSNSFPFKELKIRNHFNDSYFDSDLQKSTGYDYIPKPNTKIDFLLVDWNEFLSRTISETNKFFEEETETINVATKEKKYLSNHSLDFSRLGYLSPQEILINNTKEFDSKEPSIKNFEPDVNSNITVKIKNFNKGKKLNSTSLNNNKDISVEKNDLTNNLNGLLQNKSLKVSVFDQKVQNANKIKSLDSVFSKIKDTENFERRNTTRSFKNKHKFNNVLLSIENDDSKKNLGDSFSKARISERIDLKNSQNGVNKLSNEEIERLPNQIKSLLIDSSGNKESIKYEWFISGDNKIDNPHNESSFDINYNLLARVEVLSGFGDTNSTKKPIWKVLDYEIKEEFLRNNTKQVLCRMTPYENKELGIGCPRELQLPIINKHFLLDLSSELAEEKKEESDIEEIEIKETIKQQKKYNSLYAFSAFSNIN